MPTNLPPEAQEAENRFRAAETVEEKIASLEEFLSLVPKHKGTDRLRADYRRKLSKLKASLHSRRKTARTLSPYHIDREGAGQVVIVGPTNVGKSALLSALTNATPEVSAAPFTTWTPTPGMMEVGHVQIQLVDTPPLSEEYVDPELLNLLRRCDLILLVVDLQTHPVEQLQESITILEANRIFPLHHQELVDEQQRVAFQPLLVVVNKCDDESCDEVLDIFLELLDGDWPLVPVSAKSGRDLERLRWAVFEELGIMRIFSKAPGSEPDYSSPFVMEIGGTVEEFARKIHKDFYDKLKYARVWGSSAFDGQQVQRDYVLHDQDVVELRT